jgi:hypothetical protein
MTLDVTWVPSLYDNINDAIDQFYDHLEDTPKNENHFDPHGKYHHCTVATHTIIPNKAFFDAIEYVDFDALVDDFMDLLH